MLGKALARGRVGLGRRWVCKGTTEELRALEEVERAALWLSTYTVHNANVLRPKRDGLKVGGHQASSASLSTAMTALYMKILRPQDRVAVKPHASPMYHAIEHLWGRQSVENLQRFRALGGVQSYPSRTKDAPEVDFSTGSVGLGAATAMFSAYVQDYLARKDLPLAMQSGKEPPARMVSIVGDAELDEGSVYEALMESWRWDLRNSWWIVDLNRMSLDNVCKDGGVRQIERMFAANKFRIINVKYGKKLSAVFREPGGEALRRWLNGLGNFRFATLTFQGGRAMRQEMERDIGEQDGIQDLLASRSDDELFSLLTNLGGHCMATLLEAFDEAQRDDRPTCFMLWTVKGHGLQLAGHRDNHGLNLNQRQVDELQQRLGIPPGQEWDPLARLAADDRSAVDKLLRSAPFYTRQSRRFEAGAEVFDVPDLTCRIDKSMSTQAAFGQLMMEIAKSKEPFADRVVTCSPDVTTSTNLSGFVSVRGLFGREDAPDPAKDYKLMSMNKWAPSGRGQHIQLGIAENNLFTLLTSLGMSATTFGQRLLPVGTLYDPFIARGLDALNYGCYVDSRFLVVATPSGISLGPEGGAHQSINTPLISMGQPGLVHLEPAYADELQVMMTWALRHMQKPDGSAVYLRLSTRPLEQPERELSENMVQDILRGGYWRGSTPQSVKKVGTVVAFCGAIAPEAMAAGDVIKEKTGKEVLLLQITSPDLLVNDWHEHGADSHIANLLKGLAKSARIVCVYDAHPTSLAFLGSVAGHQVRTLGVSAFGQSGDLLDLYSKYGIDTEAIVNAALK